MHKNKGRKFTEEHKKKIGLANKISLLGKKSSIKSNEKRSVSMKLWHKEKGFSENTKEKIGNSRRGDKSNFWKGGITPLRIIIRNSFLYRQWISDVFTRDNFICQECNKKGGKLSAHHIKAFALIVEENNIKTLQEANNCDELWNINNGITLCQNCHYKTDNYGGKSNRLKNNVLVE